MKLRQSAFYSSRTFLPFCSKKKKNLFPFVCVYTTISTLSTSSTASGPCAVYIPLSVFSTKVIRSQCLFRAHPGDGCWFYLGSNWTDELYIYLSTRTQYYKDCGIRKKKKKKF